MRRLLWKPTGTAGPVPGNLVDKWMHSASSAGRSGLGAARGRQLASCARTCNIAIDIAGLFETRLPDTGLSLYKDQRCIPSPPQLRCLSDNPHPHDRCAFDLMGGLRTPPTLYAYDAMKDAFYTDVQRTINRIPRTNLLIITADWNARPGCPDNTNRHDLGRFYVFDMCINGETTVNPSVSIVC